MTITTIITATNTTRLNTYSQPTYNGRLLNTTLPSTSYQPTTIGKFKTIQNNHGLLYSIVLDVDHNSEIASPVDGEQIFEFLRKGIQNRTIELQAKRDSNGFVLLIRDNSMMNPVNELSNAASSAPLPSSQRRVQVPLPRKISTEEEKDVTPKIKNIVRKLEETKSENSVVQSNKNVTEVTSNPETNVKRVLDVNEREAIVSLQNLIKKVHFSSVPLKKRKWISLNPDDKIYYKPRDEDVLLGRGGRANNHKGNQKYLQFKLTLQNTYNYASKEEKTVISQDLVDLVHKSGGRFLKLDEEKNKWFEVPNKVARKKASQTLRERYNSPALRETKRARCDFHSTSVVLQQA